MPGRQKSDDKREAILAAASVEFGERDFHQVLMDDVSARAGVGKGTLYRYFPTKEELFIATVFRGIDEFHEQFLRVFAEEAPIEKILTDAVTRVLDYFAGRGQVLALVQRYEHRLPQADAESWQQRRDETRHAIAAVLEREGKLGRLRCGDSRLGAELLLGMVRAAIGGSLPQRAPADVARDLVGVFLDGVRGARSSQRRPALHAVGALRGGRP
jgi:AcrR family transcriptional regulator